MQTNAIERAIAAVSPQWAVRRAYARSVLAMASENGFAYEAARQGRRTDGWVTGSTGVNAEIGVALPYIRNRARDLARNNPIAAGIVRKLKAKTIGAGIVPRLRATEIGDIRRKQARDIWNAFSDNCDPEGRHDFYGMMNILAGAVYESGEALLRFLPRPSSSKLRVPLQIEILEGDWIDSSRNLALPDGGAILQGVQYNADGSRAGYWLFKQHPGDMLMTIKGGFVSEFVPAAQICHVFETLRPGQARGVSLFTPVAMRLKDVDDYQDASLMRNKIAACFAAFVKRPSGVAGSPLAAAANTSTDAKGRRVEKMSPGLVTYLGAGEEVDFGSPPAPGGEIEYVRGQFQVIAAGCGVTYSMATGDLSQSNFTQHRAGMIDFWDQLDQWQWLMFIRQSHQPVWDMVGRYAAAAGLRAPLDPWTPVWHPPMRRMTSPKEESDSMRELARSGIVPLTSAIGSQGADPEETFEEIAFGNKLMDHFGLVQDSDPRKVGRVSAGSAPTPAPEDPVKKTAAVKQIAIARDEHGALRATVTEAAA